jgi:UDP-glucose 4-epimerase
VDLVLYAFEHGESGDLFIQKAPASTIKDLAQGVSELFNYDKPIKIIGTRHGEKLYETLLTKEEKLKSEDLGDYFRVPIDKRDLNYDKYFVEGTPNFEAIEAYTSHNTRRLNVEGVKEKLLTLPFIREELGLA